MNEDKIKELRAHAGKLVAEGKPLKGEFEYCIGGTWFLWESSDGNDYIPDFADGDEWRIAKPKKQHIDWRHPYFKGCATNYGELLMLHPFSAYVAQKMPVAQAFKDLRLATPANDDSNWQYFHSTPENDAKLRALAKMVKVEVRFITGASSFGTAILKKNNTLPDVCNFRITGECQDGWTDNPEEAKS